MTFDRDKVNAISIKNTETKIELRKDEKGNWRLVEPVKDRADSMMINQLFTSAESVRHDATIGDGKKGAEKDQLKEFGLTNSETKVKFTGSEKPVELFFGKDSAVEGKVYVKLEGSNTAYVIRKDLKEQIQGRRTNSRPRLTDLMPRRSASLSSRPQLARSRPKEKTSIGRDNRSRRAGTTRKSTT